VTLNSELGVIQGH